MAPLRVATSVVAGAPLVHAKLALKVVASTVPAMWTVFGSCSDQTSSKCPSPSTCRFWLLHWTFGVQTLTSMLGVKKTS
ncbi:MAG: hypothetical protein U1F43_04030 [Myxococcota bacterium]